MLAHAQMSALFGLEGKRALVTGGSRSMGRAIALALADAGADVAVTSRNGDDAERVAVALRAKGRHIDLKGLVFVTQAAAARMIAARRGGRIVSIASIYGVVGRRKRVAYSAAKGAVVNLTRSLALELAPHGVTVNAVGPSLVETDLTRDRMRKDPAFRDEEVARTPLGRLGTSEDVAAAVVFFASPAASFITGQTLLVDGGTSAH